MQHFKKPHYFFARNNIFFFFAATACSREHTFPLLCFQMLLKCIIYKSTQSTFDFVPLVEKVNMLQLRKLWMYSARKAFQHFHQRKKIMRKVWLYVVNLYVNTCICVFRFHDVFTDQSGCNVPLNVMRLFTTGSLSFCTLLNMHPCKISVNFSDDN